MGEQKHTAPGLCLHLEKAFSGGNAVLSPDRSDDFYFTLIGSGTIKKQNEVAEAIQTAVNTYPAVADLVEALELCADEIEESVENEGKLASFTQASRKARSALNRFRSLSIGDLT
jgi:hypothetical protein